MSFSGTARRSVYSSVLVLVWIALLLPWMMRFDHSHNILAVTLLLVICGLTLRSRIGGIAAVLTYLAFVGDYRRFAGFLEGYPPNDPLLMVGPLAAGMLFLMGIAENRIRGASGLSQMIVALMVIMLIQIFNPAQGGIAVGLAGALFYLVPMLWFWVGRSWGSPEFLGFLLLRIVLPIGLLASALGIYQSFHGLLPYQLAWAQVVKFEALWIADAPRPIGFFTSSAEYAKYLLVCSVIVFACWIHERSRIVLLLPPLLAALFLASARGPIVMFVGAAAIVWAVSARRVSTWAPRVLFAGVLGLTLLGGAMLALQQLRVTGPIDALVNHQVEGLLDPTNEEKSTAVGHLYLGLSGLLKGFASPAGHGLGATTIGASKYGEGTFNSEMDISNMFYGLGPVGGLLYVAIAILVMVYAGRIWMRRRDTVALLTLGILASTLLSWLFGGDYGITALLWFVIGAVDRSAIEVAAHARAKSRPSYRVGIP